MSNSNKVREKWVGKGKETWRDIKGWKGFYQVSNHGRVKSLSRTVVRITGYKHTVRAKILKLGVVNKKFKYLNVQFSDKGNRNKHKGTNYKVTCYLVHRLVLEHFVGPCPEGMEACHNDGNPSNNKLSNLRWDSISNNHKDKNKHGTMPIGEKHANCKLNEYKVKRIRKMLAKGKTLVEIGNLFGVDCTTIGQIKRGKTWKHVK